MTTIDGSRFALSSLIAGRNPPADATGGVPTSVPRGSGEHASDAQARPLHADPSRKVLPPTAAVGPYAEAPHPEAASEGAGAVALHATPTAKGTSGAPAIRGPSRARKGRRTSAASAADDVEDVREPEETVETREPEEMSDADAEGRRHGHPDPGHGDGEGRPVASPTGVDDAGTALGTWAGVASDLRAIVSRLGGDRPRAVPARRVVDLSPEHPVLRAYREHLGRGD